jgi:hypothetical protein
MVKFSRYSSSLRSAGLMMAVLLMSEQTLSAYTDPGSGTLVWQILLGGLVGLSFELRRIKKWFMRKFKNEESPAEISPK